MPTAFIKKLSKINNVSVNTIEKFWSQAKEIAKSEGKNKNWGLITTIFKNKLKSEGYKVTASKSIIQESDGVKYEFEKLSLSEAIKTIKDVLADWFTYKKDNERFKELFDVSVNEAAFQDIAGDYQSLYIEYNNGKIWYSVGNDLLKDLRLTGIKNVIFEFPAYTAFYGKDCTIKHFDEDDEDSALVVTTEASVKHYLCNGQVVTASSKKEAIKILSSL